MISGWKNRRAALKRFDGSGRGGYNRPKRENGPAFRNHGPSRGQRTVRGGAPPLWGALSAPRGAYPSVRSDVIRPTTDPTAAVLSLRDVPNVDEVAQRKEFYRRSLDLFLLMVAKEPINVPAWGHCGLLLYELGKFDESLAYFRKIIDHEPTNTVAWDAQGFILMERADFRGAVEAFGKVLELSPKRADVAADMALCLFHTGKFAAAREILAEKAGKVMGTKEHYLMGRIAGETAGDPAPHFERALEAYRVPEGPVRQGVFATQAAMRGMILTRIGKADQAREALIEAGERASLTDPDRMILSAAELTFKVRAAFIVEVKGLLEGLPR